MNETKLDIPNRVPRQHRPASRVFFRLRNRISWNTMGALLNTSRLRVGLVLIVTVVLWILLYVMFSRGFEFLSEMQSHLPLAERLTYMIFSLFFLSLMGLMVFSTSLLLYGSMFRSPEAAFLLATPAQPDRIFTYKFREALYFCGWGFLLLGTPLLISYGVHKEAMWQYYLMLPFFLLGYLLFPGALGALACLLVVYYLPRRRKQIVFGVIAIVALALITGSFSYSFGSVTERARRADSWLSNLMDRTPSTGVVLLPSQWITQGVLLAATRPPSVETDPAIAASYHYEAGAGGQSSALGDALYYLLLIWSTSLFFFLLSAWAARRLYRPAYNRVCSAGGRPRRYRNIWIDRLFALFMSWADHRTRVFVLKDLRTFRRDPSQWAQLLILGGILLLYFMNLPRMTQQSREIQERSIIAFLNLAVLSLMLATYTCRFVFPLMSLEGTKFWILGLLPIERNRLMQSKFIYAMIFTFTTSFILSLMSGLLLGLSWQIMVFHQFSVLVLAAGLSGISVGLGAYLVNFKESNPSRIATGFGGTINLLISLGYALVIILLAAIPTLVANNAIAKQGLQNVILSPLGIVLLICTMALFCVGFVAVVVPMRMGSRAFRKMEF